MSRDSRLSVVLHVLLHMSELGQAATSETLAGLMATNPVVFRRIMAGLREAGIVRSVKGHGGGWSLARPLDSVTLADVHAALGGSSVFSIGFRDTNPRCVLERAVNRSIGSALADAEALLVARLGGVTVAEVMRSVTPNERKQMKGRPHV